MLKLFKYVVIFLLILLMLVILSILIINNTKLNPIIKIIEAKVTDITGRKFQIDGNLHLNLSLKPLITIEKVSFANANWAKQPKMLTIDNLQLQLNLLPLLKNKLIIEQLQISGLNLIVEKNKTNQKNWELKKFIDNKSLPKNQINDKPFTLPKIPIFKSVDLKDINIVYTDINAKVKTNIKLDKLHLNHKSINHPVNLISSGTINGKPFVLDGETYQKSKSGNLSLKVNAQAIGIKLSATGTIAPSSANKSIHTKIALIIPDINKSFISITGNSLNQFSINTLKPIPLKLESAFIIKNKEYIFNDIKFNLADSDIRGDISLKNLHSRPKIEANLSSKKIIIDQLISNKSVNNKPLKKQNNKDIPTKTSTKEIFSDKQLKSIVWLNRLDANINYTLNNLVNNQQRIKNILLKLDLKKGELNFKPLKMDFANGTITSHTKIKHEKDLYINTDIKIKKLDYDKLMAFIGVHEYARGDLDATIQLKGIGNSLDALMSSLTGKIRITAENGNLDSKAVKLLSTDFSSLIPFTDKSNRQKIRCMVIDFNIKKGNAESHALVIDTGIVSAIASGEINLATEKISIHLEPRAKDTSLKKLVLVPVNITGTLNSYSIVPDVVGTLSVVKGGLSLVSASLTDKLWEKIIDDTDYCKIALSGKEVTPILSTKKQAENIIDKDQALPDFLDQQ